MTISQSTPWLCESLLSKWRSSLMLSNYESTQFSSELKELDSQLDRLSKRRLKIAVFGKVGVGKSSLLNALIGEKIFPTNIGHGSTRQSKTVAWDQQLEGLSKVELVDTPGICEVGTKGRSRLAAQVAYNSDLVLLVIDSDITNVELDALETLLESGKHIMLVLNRCDQWSHGEVNEIIKSIRKRLPFKAKQICIKAVAAAPRRAKVRSNGSVRSELSTPKIDALSSSLLNLLESQGDLILSLNALKQADHFFHSLKKSRLKRRKIEAQGLIGKFAAIKASGVAINPIMIFDLATGVALDTALILQLSQLYGLELKAPSARKLLKQLSIQNSFLGGIQLIIQFILSIVKHLLVLSTPFTGGLSLAPAGPIALIQAAIAVQTTKLTGRLVAKELLLGNFRNSVQPSSILRGLAKLDPKMKEEIKYWPAFSSRNANNIKALLP